MSVILAQILALIDCGLNVISMHCKTRKNILLFFLLGNIVGATGCCFWRHMLVH